MISDSSGNGVVRSKPYSLRTLHNTPSSATVHRGAPLNALRTVLIRASFSVGLYAARASPGHCSRHPTGTCGQNALPMITHLYAGEDKNFYCRPPSTRGSGSHAPLPGNAPSNALQISTMSAHETCRKTRNAGPKQYVEMREGSI